LHRRKLLDKTEVSDPAMDKAPGAACDAA